MSEPAAPADADADPVGAGRRRPPGWALLAPVFSAGIDNYVIPPMLLALGDAFDRPLGDVATVVAAYTFAYGALQLAWGYVSGRLGRLATVRIGLAIAAVATLAGAFVDDLTLLVVLRGIVGGAFAAVTPSTITYIGDHVPVERRTRILSDLTASYAAGVAGGIVLGGVASDLASWRVGLVVSSITTTLALALQLRYPRDAVAEPRTLADFGGSLRRTLGATWPRVLFVLGLLEGASLLGFLTFFPAALEEDGLSRRTAGLVVALYGVTILVASRPVNRLARALAPRVALAGGMLIGALALGIASISHEPVPMGVAAALIAIGFALMHPLMQQWATAVLPAERATAVGVFVTGIFVGTAITTQAASPFLERIGFGWTFLVGASLALALALLVFVAWTRYERAPSPGARAAAPGD